MRLFLLGFLGFLVALAVSVSPSLLMSGYSFSASLRTRFFGARHHNGTRAARAGALPGGRAQASAGGQAGGMDSKLPAGKEPREVTEGEWKTILSPGAWACVRACVPRARRRISSAGSGRSLTDSLARSLSHALTREDPT